MLHRLKSTVHYSALRIIGLLLVTSVANNLVLADQNAPELPALFDQLLDATEEVDVRTLENRIWQHWMAAPDDSSEMLMSQISRAMAAGKLGDALILCNQLVDSTPDFAEGWNKRATLHYLLGNNDASVADIRETLVREPRHFGAISGLGLIFMSQHNFEAALEAFEQVLAISPGSVSARSNAQAARNQSGTKI